MSQLAKKTAGGAAMNIGVTVAKNVGQFLIIIPILARILTPEQFGQVAMAMTFVGFFTMFNDLGISAALVRAEKPSAAFWSSAFWINLAFGISLTLLAYFTAPLVAAFFKEPVAADLVRALSIILLLHCAFLVPMAWLQRNYKFQTIAIIDLSGIVLSSIAAVVLALNGYGVWALVWQQIIMYAVKALAGLLAHKAPLKVTFDIEEIKQVFSFSMGLTGTAFVGFINRNTDNLLIGRYLGADALGFYSRAYQVMMIPVTTLGGGLSFALYPALSAVNTDTARLGRAYVRAVSMLSVIVFPMLTGLAIVAVPFIDVLFGAQWGPVAPIVQILAFVGLLQCVGSVANDIWKARGRSGLLLRWAMIRTVGFVTAFSIGIYFGELTAMAMAYLIANIVLLVPFQLGVLKELNLSALRFLKSLAPQFVSTLIMSVGLLSVGTVFPGLQALSSPLQLLILVSIGAAAYALSMGLFFRGFVRGILNDFHALRSKDGPAASADA